MKQANLFLWVRKVCLDIHIYSSDYQTSINQKYDIGELISYYQGGSFPIKNYRKWQGRYDNYIDYINNTFGLEMSRINFLAETLKKHTFGEQSDNPNKFLTIQSVLNDFLQYNNIGYAMEKENWTVTNPMAN